MINISIFLVFIVMSSIVYADESSQPKVPFVNPDVTYATNIHNNGYYCTECHRHKPTGDGDKFLLYNDYSLTCRCHGYTTKKYTHPIGCKLSAEKKEMVPADFPLEEGMITCNTCHAIVMQCRDSQNPGVQIENFLRVDSSQTRTAICYACHDKTKYARLNPHEQFDQLGRIIESKCLYCHKFKPDEKTATLKKQRAGETGTVEFVAELFTLCFRCHFKQTDNHLVNANHVTRQPPAKILANIQNSERRLDIILPLDDKGGLTCATCHNPHQRGIIPSSSPASKGASEVKRLRVPKEGNRICRACHQGH